MNQRSFKVAVCTSLVLVMTGCQTSVSPDYGKLDLKPVRGTITLEGEPLANYHVIFQDQTGAFSFGKTDRNGKYTLMFNSEKEGVLPGEKTVRIRRKGFSERELFADQDEFDSENEEVVAEGDMQSADPSSPREDSSGQLPESYHIRSKIRAMVESGSQVIDFDLKKDGSTTGPKT